MNDLISRQAAIDAIGNYLKKDGDQIVIADVVDAAVAIGRLPSAQPEQRWIPCSERLPETRKTGNSFSGFYMKSQPVLVYGVAEYEEIAEFHVASYCDDLNGDTYWSTELDAVTINGVKAWMPLPAPYKER